MEIVELRSAAERTEVLPILRQLYPSLDEGRYLTLLAEMIDDGYRQFAVRNKAEEIVALAGVAVHVNLYYGRHLYVYDLVVKEDERSEVTRSPVTRCARRCVERVVALQDCAEYFALPRLMEDDLKHCA